MAERKAYDFSKFCVLVSKYSLGAFASIPYAHVIESPINSILYFLFSVGFIVKFSESDEITIIFFIPIHPNIASDKRIILIFIFCSNSLLNNIIFFCCIY